MSNVLASFQQAVAAVFHFLTANLFRRQHLLVDSDLSSQAMKHIVIVGGSFAGVGTAHRLLKQASKTATGPFKVTLVSRDSHFYWNIAAPRGLLPGQIPEEKLFQPIADGLTHYPADRFEFVLGSATGIDVEKKQLEVSDSTGQAVKLSYDYLILGTGSRTKAVTPFKSMGSTESTRDALRESQVRVKTARTIVVVGAGPTGVEVAGELAFEYGESKQIILISGGPTVLENRPASVSRTAEKQLRALKVDVRVNTKVLETVTRSDSRQEITLSGGGKLVADMSIPTYGIQPNSSFIPADFLDANGFVKVDDYLSVKGAEGVFAIGDVSNVEPPQFLCVERQSAHMAKNMVLVLRQMLPLPYKASTTAMMGLQIGKKTGTGHFGNFKIPGFVAASLRKTLFVERLPRYVDGSSF